MAWKLWWCGLDNLTNTTSNWLGFIKNCDFFPVLSVGWEQDSTSAAAK